MRTFQKIAFFGVAVLFTLSLSGIPSAKEPAPKAGKTASATTPKRAASPVAKPADQGLHREDVTLEEMQAYHQ